MGHECFVFLFLDYTADISTGAALMICVYASLAFATCIWLHFVTRRNIDKLPSTHRRRVFGPLLCVTVIVSALPLFLVLGAGTASVRYRDALLVSTGGGPGLLLILAAALVAVTVFIITPVVIIRCSVLLYLQRRCVATLLGAQFRCSECGFNPAENRTPFPLPYTYWKHKLILLTGLVLAIAIILMSVLTFRTESVTTPATPGATPGPSGDMTYSISWFGWPIPVATLQRTTLHTTSGDVPGGVERLPETIRIYRDELGWVLIHRANAFPSNSTSVSGIWLFGLLGVCGLAWMVTSIVIFILDCIAGVAAARRMLKSECPVCAYSLPAKPSE